MSHKRAQKAQTIKTSTTKNSFVLSVSLCGSFLIAIFLGATITARTQSPKVPPPVSATSFASPMELVFNAFGVQADGIFTEGKDEDFSIDILMESKGQLTEDGFTSATTTT